VSTQALPASPDPVAVTVAPAASALLVLDVADVPCGAQPRCVAVVPRIAALLAAARRAGAFIVHSSGDRSAIEAPAAQPPFLAEVAPNAGELVITGGGQDRFFGTLLDQNLRRRGITTLILAGWRINGSLLYTAVGANLRAYTVVVADDATSAPHDYDIAVGRYQLLTQLNANPENRPLRTGTVTLSRTDLIAFS
jgi:nicotinamidase-related amidase